MITPTPNAVATKPVTTPRATWETNGHYVAITLTDALRNAIEARAKADDTTPGLLARSIVADFLGITVDVTRSAPRKYATEDEKKTAQTVSRLNGAALKHKLMADHFASLGNATQAEKYRKLQAEAEGKVKTLELPMVDQPQPEPELAQEVELTDEQKADLLAEIEEAA